EDLFRAVQRVAQVKPVVATIGSSAASGGYMAVLGAQRVFAHEESDVGSIGVFIPHISVAGLLSKLGIEVELLHHGRHKDAYQGLRPLTEEEKGKVLAVARVGYDSFIEMVARQRKLPVPRVQELATGEFWSGKQALSLGLVDALGDREDALEHLSKLTGISPSRAVQVSPAIPFLRRIAPFLAPGMSDEVGLGLRRAVEETLEDLVVQEGRLR
ncbi:MAG: S49 family peptidase, partial [Candidatus Thermoplasmatota archaeon]|nr:S49 family peptidase [Candidatus Thermoplasmatota archaeon]